MGSAGENLPSGAGAVENQPLLPQAADRGLVAFAATALPDDFAVPVQTEMVQRAHDLVGGTGNNARGIEILDTEQPAPALPPGEAVAAHRGDQGTEMKRTGRARGEASDRLVFSAFSRHTRNLQRSARR